MPNNILLSTCYLAPVNYYRLLVRSPLFSGEEEKGEAVVIEQHEHFHKQTYRNRANIYGPNGLLPLIIPVKYRNHTAVKDVMIAYDYNWQKQHWRALESAYRNSPYFEFYESDLLPFYQNKFECLIEFNISIQKKILELVGVKVSFQLTTSYVNKPEGMEDLREAFHPKVAFSPLSLGEGVVGEAYPQVFGDKFGFIPNLSIIDLLFNSGPHTIEYLMK
jgi:hypothetical protein